MFLDLRLYLGSREREGASKLIGRLRDPLGGFDVGGIKEGPSNWRLKGGTRIKEEAWGLMSLANLERKSSPWSSIGIEVERFNEPNLRPKSFVEFIEGEKMVFLLEICVFGMATSWSRAKDDIMISKTLGPGGIIEPLGREEVLVRRWMNL